MRDRLFLLCYRNRFALRKFCDCKLLYFIFFVDVALLFFDVKIMLNRIGMKLKKHSCARKKLKSLTQL